jgi:putative ABC transport system ATP-binding protein
MYLAGLYTPIQREQRSAELLGMVGLAGFENKLPAAVSGGQQQSAAIARALANDPPILIADEPTGNLDSRTADEVFALFSSLVEQGKTILMVTHDISLARRTTRTLLIADGEIINAWVASALHHLGHSEMLWLSKNLKMHLYLPADLIYSYQGAVLNGGSPDWLALPVNGRLEVFESASARQPLYSISAGEYICSLALQPGQEVRAQPDEPIEVLQLSGSELLAWLNSHPSACQGLASGHPNNAVKIAQAGRP